MACFTFFYKMKMDIEMQHIALPEGNRAHVGEGVSSFQFDGDVLSMKLPENEHMQQQEE
jgi:hypothetical protein